MRVYEFAKLHGVTSKEVLAVLEDGGFGVANHMAVLESNAHKFVEKAFASKPKKKVVSVAAEAKTSGAVKKASASTKIKPIKKVPSLEKEKSVSKLKVPSVKNNKEFVAQSEVIAPLLQEQAKTLEQTKKPEEKKVFPQQVPQEKVIVKQENIAPKASLKSPPTVSSGTTRPIFAPRPANRSTPNHKIPSFNRPSQMAIAPIEVTEITVSGDMTLQDAADCMGKNVSELILALLKRGIASSKSNVISFDTINLLAAGFGITVNRGAKKETTEAAKILRASSAQQTRRAPIVVIIGHVDHGKTTLLDYLRKSNIAAREKGGITQHLGAYEVASSHGKIVFLDTPGHAAFSSMRARGVKMTDLAILVVAADDGIMPQTIEAINQARAAGVPLVVAINKIDKVTTPAPIETIKRQLSQQDLLVEDWGGSVICVPISAKTGQGVSDLLEMIQLQADMMDLYADVSVPAKAFVLESRLDKGFGAIATVLVLEGTLKQGDYFMCGQATGRVRLILNSVGEQITQTGPSSPVQVVGFDKLAHPADVLTVITVDEYRKAKATKKPDTIMAPQATRISLDTDKKSDIVQIKLIIKSDNFGSKEAIEGSIATLSKKNKDMAERLKLVYVGIGDITESDVDLAENTGAQIIGFHVKAEKNAAIYAKEHEVSITLYHVIYHLVEALEALVKQPKKAIIVVTKAGEAVVRKVFPLKDNTVIAGCQVTQGVFGRNGKAVCFRNGVKVGEARITSLQRDRKSVKEVHSGFEMGFITDDFHDWKVNDVVHYMMETKEIPVD